MSRDEEAQIKYYQEKEAKEFLEVMNIPITRSPFLELKCVIRLLSICEDLPIKEMANIFLVDYFGKKTSLLEWYLSYVRGELINAISKYKDVKEIFKIKPFVDKIYRIAEEISK